MIESADEKHRKLLERRRELAKRPEAKAKKAASMREYRKRGYYKRPDVLAKKRARYAEYSKRPEVKEHKAAHRRQYYERPEVRAKLLAYQKDRYLKNAEILKAYAREHEKRPEVKESRREYRKRPEVRERQKVHMKKWRHENREKQKVYLGKWRRKKAEWFLKLKSELKCSKCGQSYPDYPTVMEFHHKGNAAKDGRISSLVTGSASRNLILKELDKCIPLCANCHRKLHYDTRKGVSKKRIPLEWFY